MHTITPLLSHNFKLSLLSLALFGVQSSFAEEVQTLSTIQLQAQSANTEESSEKTKAYIVKKSSNTTKLNLKTQETPQTINVVTRQQLDDFAISNTRDVLRNTPGVSVSSQETDRTSYLSRGFEISNIQVDGIGFPLEGYNYNNSNPDTFLYDRVEVIKGADALSNAIGDPSATINMVRKRPTRNVQGSVSASYGSWDTQRYEADVSSALTEDGRIRGRVFGYQQTGDSYLDHYAQEKNGVGAIVEADLTDSTLLTAGYSHTNSKSDGNNWGANPLMNSSGAQLGYSRAYNYSPDWTYWDSNIQNYFAELKQQLGGDWELKLNYDETHIDRDAKLLYLSGNPGSDNTSGIFLWPGRYIDDNKERQASISAQGTFPLFGQRHEAVIGYSWAENQINGVGYGGSYSNPLTTDLASWTPAEPTWDMTQTSGEAHMRQNLQSYYAATRIHFNDDLKMILGSNYVQAKSKGNSYGADAYYDEDKVLPYAGLTYNFTPEYTGYMSYSSIFRPQTTRALDGSLNKPIEGESYELGVKSSWLDDRLTGSMAIFRTEESNYPLRNSDGLPINRKVQVSDLRSQGYEFGLAGQLSDNLNVSFGYTLFSLKDLINGGQARTYNPDQMFNLLTTYTVPQLPQLKIGAGVQWQDKTYLDVPEATDTAGVITQNAGIIRQDSYALINLMASYEINDQLSLQANANNITNEKYLFNFPDAQGFYGAPANYSVAVRYKY